VPLHDCYAEETGAIEQETAEQQRYITSMLTRLSDATVQRRTTSASLSKRLVDSILSRLSGVKLDDPTTGVVVVLKRIDADLAMTVPRISADVEISHPVLSTPVLVSVTGAVRPEWAATQNQSEGNTHMILRVRLLALKHEQLPSMIAALFTTELLKRLNALIPPIDVVIPREFTVKPSETNQAKLDAALSNLEVPLPNGRLSVAIKLSSLPEIRMSIVPQIVFGSVDGLHVVGLIGEGSLQEMRAGSEAQGRNFEELVESYRLPPNKDFSVTIPSHAVLQALTELNDTPTSARTFKLVGTPRNHILDRTGGAPAGNGFKSWFEGKPTGDWVITNIEAVWLANTGVNISALVKMTGRAQVHVHGNSPHIPGPRIFGRRIGGGIGLGGGAGTSVGGTLSGTTPVKGLVTVDRESGEFLFKLTAPDEIRLSINTKGIVADLIELLRVGLKFSVPLGRLKMAYILPNSNMTVEFPDHTGSSEAAQDLQFEASDYDTEFLADRLELSAVVQIKTQSRGREHGN
jgi:hypothetical protein